MSADVAERENRDAETGEVDSFKDETGPESVAVRQMVLDWLASHLATVEVVGTKPTPWCTEWRLHPEVVARIKALWQASMQAEANVMGGRRRCGLVLVDKPLGSTGRGDLRQGKRAVSRLRPCPRESIAPKGYGRGDRASVNAAGKRHPVTVTRRMSIRR
ncbi:hypothetical protein GCM10027057_16810 [Marisediminicola antarctica]